ncbi:sulfurtransferase [Alkalicoccus daliensis]|uniref:Thiosulfate/3-mercaptopyruvate sulfurtransferase n=1 Tax=Alkalicoccus daliensis TaxID=745820 RepID=A0A1H0JMD2_9BACI|nr:sulfurtransferase [Alkalicoccus daliensis]SDO44928.1 thiosulfate/3-mercaptopyruvate sulfurtransferase [Alkalicoccus daliensis]
MDVHPLVTTDWLFEHKDDDNLRIIDATVFMEQTDEGLRITPGEEAYQLAHLPNAVFANLLTQFSDVDAAQPLTALPHESFVHEARGLGIDDDTTVVIYDRGPVVGATFTSSDWASRLWWQFRLSGHNKVFVLGGGLPKWKQEAKPLTEEIPLTAAGSFIGRYRPELYATINDIKDSMYDEKTIIMNCLSSEDFRGETNNYPRKGHIPGSEHVFFGDLSTPSGSLPHEDTLRAIFTSTGALDPEKKVITYCGGGVAATWNALALASLGKEAAVYDGSLNEWMSDKENPLSTSSE